MKRTWSMALVSLAAVALAASSLAAADDAPDPLKVLKKAASNLAKESRDGYAATLEVEGGLSKSTDHRLDVMTTVQESYKGEIRREVMHVPAMNVFRTSQKGALSDGVQWYQLQALPEGKKLDRLFAFPVDLLAKAVAKPEKIEWLPSTEQAKETEEEESVGHTSVARQLTTEQLYHRIRVQVPDEEALQYFIEVQNSGCLSGG